ncbi:helix-turn-helix transcriptional regulator [Streptomyces sp. H28]|uniref:helix-turn-helix domain-containing protein n=1 Tax=Streptomyces sp. H28 TaxID=2775865 RepID=UPI00177F890B|nr:helix-turn-helix transcriptional regulator [Streptomyces sp. H28]MBD9734896.1 helix-turn-helix transcriptional regulator [Streptomyces sp. H28]
MNTDGRLIRRKRIGLGHGVNRFAALAGISGAALSRIENGLRSPRPETLKKITDALGCQIYEVMAEKDGFGPEVQSGSAAGNDEAAGVQPAASVERIRTTAKKNGTRS